MVESKTAISLPSIKAPGPRRLGSVGSVAGHSRRSRSASPILISVSGVNLPAYGRVRVVLRIRKRADLGQADGKRAQATCETGRLMITLIIIRRRHLGPRMRVEREPACWLANGEIGPAPFKKPKLTLMPKAKETLAARKAVKPDPHSLTPAQDAFEKPATRSAKPRLVETTNPKDGLTTKHIQKAARGAAATIKKFGWKPAAVTSAKTAKVRSMRKAPPVAATNANRNHFSDAGR